LTVDLYMTYSKKINLPAQKGHFFQFFDTKTLILLRQLKI
jgi:hypothetical protein